MRGVTEEFDMDGESGKPRSGLRESEVALDLTRLKNWSNFEETAYRDFSQQRAERRGNAHRRLDESRRIAAEGVPAATEPASAPPPVLMERVAPPVEAPAPAASMVPPAPLAPPAPPIPSATAPVAARPAPAPASTARTARVVVAVYSFTGGVGKSTICAHLARSLYGSGEHVLLVDPSGHAMLPTYFGSQEERDGLRKFCAPGETHASVLVASREAADVEWLREEVAPLMGSVDRTIFDLGGAAPAVVEEVLAMAQLLLIPVVPGPQAAVTVSRVTAWLAKLRTRGAGCPRVYYLMNRVDEHRESDRRTLEAMQEICGEALAPIALAESEEVEYAFAERMTVSDFHTTAPLALQYEKLAIWMRKLLPPSTPPPARRWSEV